jgi:hypothetical protein
LVILEGDLPWRRDTFLARISEAVARDLSGGDAAGDFRGRESALPHTQPRDGQPAHARYVDAETGKPVGDEDQVKGYKREDGEYVIPAVLQA